MMTKLPALSFLLVASTMAAFFTAAHAEDAPVLDLEGNQLRFGVPYYASPVLRPLGNVGLPPETPKEPCPKEIILTRFPDRGIPLIFTSAVQNTTGNITVSSEVLISFNDTERCGVSTAWTTREDSVLTIGGEAEETTVFRITREGPAIASINDYSLEVLLRPDSVPSPRLVVDYDWYSWRLMVLPSAEGIRLPIYFVEAKTDESKEAVIKMPQSM